MSPGSLLTVNSRRVDLDVWRAHCVRVALIAAEVRTEPIIYACCAFYVLMKSKCVVRFHCRDFVFMTIE